MARNERQGWLYGPVAVHGVQVGVANTRSGNLHQDLPVLHLGHGYFFNAQRLPVLTGNGGFHGLWHGVQGMRLGVKAQDAGNRLSST
jgi:hypothetical protein